MPELQIIEPVSPELPKIKPVSTSAASRWFEILQVLLLTLAIVAPVRLFLAKPFQVEGASMEPAFFNKEYLIVDEISYRFQEPRRGEVVVFHPPTDPGKYFIKRVIGLPGETVELINGEVKVYNKAHPNGWVLNESSYLDTSDYSIDEKAAMTLRPVTVGPDEYFLMGDNRRASYDSRYFGPIKRDTLIGRAWFRGFPIQRAGALTQLPSYPEPGR